MQNGQTIGLINTLRVQTILQWSSLNRQVVYLDFL